MDFIKLLLVITLASIIPGQLIRIPVGQLATITISDVSVILLIILFFIYALAIGKKLNIPWGIFTLLLVFSLIALASTILSATRFTPNQIISALLFQLRFIAYFLISIVVANLIDKRQLSRWLNLFIPIGIIFTTASIAQFILVPDLSFLVSQGWDPHQKRLVSTLLDPNFTGGVLIILLSITTSLFLFQKKNFYLVLTLFYFIGIILTFSRSSYLALLVSLATIGILKSPKFSFSFLALFIFVIITNNQARLRIMDAFTIDQTVQARLESYTKAISIFQQNPVFGVGFNTYRYAQSQYGFFSPDEPLGGHSGAGSDSSLLLIAATTGILGLTTFLLFMLSIFKILIGESRKSYIGLSALASFSAIAVHSQFVNSFFYPQIMILIWFTLGLVYVAGKKP